MRFVSLPIMKILLIEDDADIASNIGQFFEDKGHELDYAFSGTQGLQLATGSRFDLIILDLMLPGKDGISLCRDYRETSPHATPILMLTARDTLDDKIAGFDAGADDYLVKPFSLLELEARVQALTRRVEPVRGGSVLRVAEVELNRDNMQVSREGRVIGLKPKTFAILKYLMRNAERNVPRRELVEYIWPDQAPEGDPLRVHIHSLRQSIDKPFANALIHTVHGVGYRFGRTLP